MERRPPRWLCTAVLTATLLAAGSAAAQEAPSEGEEADLDAEIEAALAADEAAVLQDAPEEEAAPASATTSMNPDISLILDVAGAWFSDDEPLLVGGHDPSDFGFNLQSLELAIGADVDPFFRFDSAIIFSLFGVEVEEAYATTTALPWGLQLRAGQFKTRFGRINPTHLHRWHFVTQPVVNGKFFGGESLRGLGVELSQLVPLPWYGLWLVAVQDLAGEETGRSFRPDAAEVDDPLDLTVVPRLENFFELSPSWSLLWGLSYALGRNGSGRGNTTEIWGSDLFLHWSSVSSGGRSELGWQSEAMLRRRQVPLAVLQDFGLNSYVYWQPDRLWELAARYEFVTDAEAVAGDEGAADPLDPAWDEPRHRVSTNLSYRPSHFSQLRLEYALDVAPYNNLDERDELIHQVFLQLELVAGAHDAHTF